MPPSQLPTKHAVAYRKGLVAVHEHCPDRPYLELVVPDDCAAAVSVEYTIDSRDQGFCDNPKAHSFSWFQAFARRSHDRNNLRGFRVCENRLGNPEFYKRTADRWVLDHPWEVNWKPWLNALLPGDVIELVPLAIFPGWLNIVREAQIKLEYKAKDIHPQELTVPKSPSAQDHPLYTMPLDAKTNQLRVLTIEPGSFEDPISCRLVYTQVDGATTCTDYDALSYVCGALTDRTDIRVQLPNSDSYWRTISIPRTAESAIRHLRSASEEVKLWVDSACINEYNQGERASQVRNMGLIFSQARLVHVWLGHEHEGIEACLRIIRDACNAHHGQCEGGELCKCLGTRHRSRGQIQQFVDAAEGEPSVHQTLEAVFQFHWRNFNHNVKEYSGGQMSPHVSKLMSHLFDHAWFCRVWVLQEVLKSRRAVVHFAKEMVTWEELVTINAWLSSEDFVAKTPHLRVSEVAMPRIWSRLSTVVSNDQQSTSSQAPNIIDVFISSLDMKVTDPRDKLFAIQSLGRDTCVDENMPQLIGPNYEKSEAQVLADFTRWWIQEYKSLAILSLVHGHRARTWQRMLCDSDTESLPRPSWTVPFEGRERWYRTTLEALFKFRATGSTCPDLGLLQVNATEANPLVIRLLGYPVAEIQEIKYLSLESQEKVADQGLLELLEAFHRIYDPSNIEENWTKSTVSDRHRTFRSKEAPMRLANHVWAHQWSAVSAIDPFSPNIAPGAFIDTETSSVPSCIDPCIFTTTDGLLGLCPWTAKKGDKVALLLGGNVPYLLRCQPNTDDVAFVGESFLLGIMHGEYLQMRKEKGIQPVVFSIS